MTYVYYRCSGSRGRAECRRKCIREDRLEAQFAEQLRAIEVNAHIRGKLREALKEIHGHEQGYRKSQLATLQRRHDDIQKRRDALLNGYLDQVVAEDDYKRASTTLISEQAMVQADTRTLEGSQDKVFEHLEKVVELAGRVSIIFEKGDAERKRALVGLVALNATLEGRKARLN